MLQWDFNVLELVSCAGGLIATSVLLTRWLMQAFSDKTEKSDTVLAAANLKLELQGRQDAMKRELEDKINSQEKKFEEAIARIEQNNVRMWDQMSDTHKQVAEIGKGVEYIKGRIEPK